MPLPTPNPNEDLNDFVDRCMGNPTMNDDFPDVKQRRAVCQSQWEKKKGVNMEGDEVIQEDQAEKSKGEKYYSDMPVMVDAQYKPFGGATTFEEVEEWELANERRFDVNKVIYTAEDLMRNVMIDDDVEDKPNKLQKIIDGMRSRLSDAMNKVLHKTKDEPEEESDPESELTEAEKQATKTEDGVLFRPSDYAVVPDSQKPSSWKLRLAEGKSGNFTVAQVARAITAMQPGGFRGQKVELESDQKAQAVKRISAAIGKTDGTDDQKDNLRKRLNRVKDVSVSPFQVIKGLDGSWRWIGIPSNKWRDRDEPAQIIEEKAHQDFIEYLEKTKAYPVLLSWHTPGTRIGQADFCDYTNGFLVMGGPIDKGKEEEAERLAEKCMTEPIGMSHGFVYGYADKTNEIIGWYRTWEVSHLPMDKAANQWTSIDIINKEVEQMGFSPEKRKYLVDMHGEDFIAGIESKAAELEKDLLSTGVEFKEFTDPDADQPIDTSAIAQEAAKMIAEHETFKAIATTIESLKDLPEKMTAMEARLDAVEATAKGVEEKVGKSADDMISEALGYKGPRKDGFQASKDGEPPTDDETKQVKDETGVEAPEKVYGLEPNMMQGLKTMVFGPTVESGQ